MKFYLLIGLFGICSFTACSALYINSKSGEEKRSHSRLKLYNGNYERQDTHTSWFDGCRKEEDCPESHCCTVGMMRYSVPSCFPLGETNDPCIPNNSPQNFTLSYPTSEVLHVNGYITVCPCAPQFVCDRSTVTCQSQIDSSLDQNELTK